MTFLIRNNLQYYCFFLVFYSPAAAKIRCIELEAAHMAAASCWQQKRIGHMHNDFPCERAV
jgi:hypothetical protein